MKDQLIVALGRENGSGGHELAASLAEKLGVELYDTAVIRSFIEKTGLTLQGAANEWDEQQIRFFAPKKQNKFNSTQEQMAAALTFQFLRMEAAAGHSFVITGRAADAILKDCPGLVTIFVHADQETKVQRLVEKENLTPKKAVKKMKAVDKQRRAYHDYYADTKWGEASTYDLTVNSAGLSFEQLSDSVISYLKIKVPGAF